MKSIEVKNLSEVLLVEDILSDDYMDANLNGILDIFDHCLTEEEAGEYSFEYVNHHLKNEYKLIDYIKHLHCINVDTGGTTVVKFDIKELSGEEILNVIQGLDIIDKINFLKFLKETDIKFTQPYFEIEDLEDIGMLTKLNSRELQFVSFYFSALEIFLVGNFDLVYVVFFKDKEQIQWMKDNAKTYKLFVRDIRGDKNDI